jgi:hypothetical protein
MFKLAGLLVVALVIVGCHSGPTPTATKTNYYYQDEDASKAAQQGKEFEDPSKVASSGVTKAQLAQLEAQQAKMADQLAGQATNTELKKQFITQTDELGQAEMACDDQTPHDKYSKALKYYRQVLKVDPKDGEANKWVGQIVAVYKSMGRAVPQ